MKPKIDIRDLHFATDDGREILSGITLSILPGEILCVMGLSGSGKSTLLQLLGLLMTPDSGALSILGEDFSAASSSRAAEFRQKHVGMIFQSFNLLPQLTAEQNVVIACTGRARDAQVRARESLHSVGLGDRAQNLPGELSGGEQQRVAFARAVVNQPDLLLADEPTGNLDTENEEMLMDQFRDWVSRGRSALIVSHSAEVADRADRVIDVAAGRIARQAA